MIIGEIWFNAAYMFPFILPKPHNISRGVGNQNKQPDSNHTTMSEV